MNMIKKIKMTIIVPIFKLGAPDLYMRLMKIILMHRGNNGSDDVWSEWSL